jgi:hypothetical protein
MEALDSGYRRGKLPGARFRAMIAQILALRASLKP